MLDYCKLCLTEKFYIIQFLDDKNLLNKKCELVSKCRHQNKLLLSNLKRNDTMDSENCILYLYCSLPENSFCRVFSRVGISGLILTANGLAVFYMRRFLLTGIVEQTLVFLFLFISGKQNM